MARDNAEFCSLAIGPAAGARQGWMHGFAAALRMGIQDTPRSPP